MKGGIYIINTVIEILQLIMPGYLGIVIFQFINNIEIDSISHVLYSIFFSAIVFAIISLLPVENNSAIFLLSTLLALTVSIAFSCIIYGVAQIEEIEDKNEGNSQ